MRSKLRGMANVLVGIVDCDSPEEEEALNKGGDPLRTLCQKEVESFDQFLRQWGSEQTPGSIGNDYAEGLAQWERQVVEGFLYQKIMGRF